MVVCCKDLKIFKFVLEGEKFYLIMSGILYGGYRI